MFSVMPRGMVEICTKIPVLDLIRGSARKTRSLSKHPPPLQLYEFVEFFGEWGGYLGIIIGTSFLDTVPWLTGMINRMVNSSGSGVNICRSFLRKVKSSPFYIITW